MYIIGLYVHVLKNMNAIMKDREKITIGKNGKNQCQDFQSYLMTLALMAIGSQRKELILSFNIQVTGNSFV